MNRALIFCIVVFLFMQSCNSDKIAGHYYNGNTKGRECLHLMESGRMEHYYRDKHKEVLDTGTWNFDGTFVEVKNMRWFNLTYPSDTAFFNANFTLSWTGILSMGDDEASFWKTNWCKIDHTEVRERLLKNE